MADTPVPPDIHIAPTPAADAATQNVPAAGAPPAAPPAPGPKPQATPVVVKKYANRRLYNTETSSYITLDNLAEMIRAGRDFAVYDAKTGEDITRGVLTQIIVEEEAKGSALLPTAFLRQLIGFYGDSLQGVVPKYLEQAMANFARQQQQMRQVVQQTFGTFMPMGIEEMGRQNMALMERAMSMWNPFHRMTDAPGAQPAEAQPASEAAPHAAPAASADKEMEGLRHEIDSLRAQLAIARAEAVVGPIQTPVQAPVRAPAMAANPDRPAQAPRPVPPRKSKHN